MLDALSFQRWRIFHLLFIHNLKRNINITMNIKSIKSVPKLVSPVSCREVRRYVVTVVDATKIAIPNAGKFGVVGPTDRARGFLDYQRAADTYRDPMIRVSDWDEIVAESQDPVNRTVQAARCMDCGTPFCQTHSGCPVNNLIPEWNELVYKGQWRDAIDRLHATNNFPEFTGRVCPAPCEGACVAGLIDQPVTIKNIEYSIIERAWAENWVVPRIPKIRSGKRVGIVGSGPAGLAAADCLNQAGHTVTVHEREDRIGGLLMYGIPNMKLKKDTVDRRVNLLEKEGVTFVTGSCVGAPESVSFDAFQAQFDAIVLCVGSTMPRDLEVPGRELGGVHFAMEFLTRNQKRLLMTRTGTIESAWRPRVPADVSLPDEVLAAGRDVVVIGGGDTGTDCIGTALRHRCKSVTNIELLSKPPLERAASNPWPQWPRVFGADYAHAEAQAVFGQDPRNYGLTVTRFLGDGTGGVSAVVTQEVCVTYPPGGGPPIFDRVAGTEKEWPASLVILALGFVAPETKSLSSQLRVHLDDRGNVKAKYGEFLTSNPGVFAAGDCRRGQSLVVWAINEGRGAAKSCHEFLSK